MVSSSRMHDHKSAICIIPPRHLWDAIQDIRLFNDKSFVRCETTRKSKEYRGAVVAVFHALTYVLIPLCRWPPHINLLYPFYEDTGNAFQECTEAAAQALSTLQPFEVGFAHSILREPRNAHCASLERSYLACFVDPGILSVTSH